MKTLKNALESTLEIKKSEFITFLFFIKDEEDAKNYINDIHLKHPKANHHCVAYVLKNENIFRFDDDNEPQHTSGKVMLNVLMHQDINNILAIVVRYFGGVKLGKGGLIKAYTQSVTNALLKAEFTELILKYNVSFNCPFQYAAALEAYAHHINARVNSVYKNDYVVFSLIVNHIELLEEQLHNLTKGEIKLLHVDTFYE